MSWQSCPIAVKGVALYHEIENLKQTIDSLKFDLKSSGSKYSYDLKYSELTKTIDHYNDLISEFNQCLEKCQLKQQQMADECAREAQEAQGTIYQRGPRGAAPTGQSINGVAGAYGTIGASEHVTDYGNGWHRSWDNSGTRNDHTTNHSTRNITQNNR